VEGNDLGTDEVLAWCDVGGNLEVDLAAVGVQDVHTPDVGVPAKARSIQVSTKVRKETVPRHETSLGHLEPACGPWGGRLSVVNLSHIDDGRPVVVSTESNG
jgi:hypothetical protein